MRQKRTVVELAARRQRRRVWLTGSATGTVAAALLVLVLNLPDRPPPVPPMVIPPGGSVVVERLADRPTSPPAASPETAKPEPATAFKAVAGQEEGPAVASMVQEKVIFVTDKYAGWDWHKSAYPADGVFAVAAGPAGAKAAGWPPAAAERLRAVDFSRQLAVVACLGTGSGADGIGIEKVTVTGDTLTVRVRTKSIRPGQFETMNITSPADVVAIDRSLSGGATSVIFLDQKGTVLARQQLER